MRLISDAALRKRAGLLGDLGPVVLPHLMWVRAVYEEELAKYVSLDYNAGRTIAEQRQQIEDMRSDRRNLAAMEREDADQPATQD